MSCDLTSSSVYRWRSSFSASGKESWQVPGQSRSPWGDWGSIHDVWLLTSRNHETCIQTTSVTWLSVVVFLFIFFLYIFFFLVLDPKSSSPQILHFSPEILRISIFIFPETLSRHCASETHTHARMHALTYARSDTQTHPHNAPRTGMH